MVCAPNKGFTNYYSRCSSSDAYNEAMILHEKNEYVSGSFCNKSSGFLSRKATTQTQFKRPQIEPYKFVFLTKIFSWF
jgi:hypothetical protein